ncbi:hypothetical protein [Deinococcus altitudinis]|uniref:hypothetical protein n=1 Tax=Deinococcus altitudinis TaxID=468914 RepID=UPI003892CAE4
MYRRQFKFDMRSGAFSVLSIAPERSFAVWYVTRRKSEVLVRQPDPTEYEPPLANPPVQYIHSRLKDDEMPFQAIERTLMLETGQCDLRRPHYLGSCGQVLADKRCLWMTHYFHIQSSSNIPDRWSYEFTLEGDEPDDLFKLHYSFLSFDDPRLTSTADYADYLPELTLLLQEPQ